MTAPGRLAGKTAIVTGGSRGIGRAVALALAGEGCAVVVAAKSERERPNLPGTIHAAAAEIEAAGGRALAVRTDVRRFEDLEALVATTMERFGRIDIVINNAGALWWTDVLDTPLKRFDLVMEINVRAAFGLTRLALPHLIAAGGGHLLVYSPPVDLQALPGRTAYLISKFGMTMLAIGLAEEVRAQKVSVNALWPVTAIETAAVINFGVGDRTTWRTPGIMADATLEIVTTPPGELTGQSLLDEDFLRARGWSDFSRYRCDPDHEPPRYALRDLPRAGRVAPKR
jgi:citronellol/citronellal dehydrogenase